MVKTGDRLRVINYRVLGMRRPASEGIRKSMKLKGETRWQGQQRHHRADRHGPSCEAYWICDPVRGSSALLSPPTMPWLEGWL